MDIDVPAVTVARILVDEVVAVLGDAVDLKSELFIVGLRDDVEDRLQDPFMASAKFARGYSAVVVARTR